MAILVSKNKAYDMGAYMFDAPPVITVAWNKTAWINYIDSHGKWTTPVLDNETILVKGILSIMPSEPFSNWSIEKLDDEEEDAVFCGTYNSPMNHPVEFELHMKSFDKMAVSLWARGGSKYNPDSMYLNTILKLLVEHFKQFYI